MVKAPESRIKTTAHRPLFQSRRTGHAAMVEALVLVAMLAFCVAIIIQLFSVSGSLGASARDRTIACGLAANAAEAFSAQPSTSDERRLYTRAGDETDTADDAYWMVLTDAESEETEHGTMYAATVCVIRAQDGEEVVSVEAKRYATARNESSSSNEQSGGEDA